MRKTTGNSRTASAPTSRPAPSSGERSEQGGDSLLWDDLRRGQLRPQVRPAGVLYRIDGVLEGVDDGLLLEDHLLALPLLEMRHVPEGERVAVELAHDDGRKETREFDVVFLCLGGTPP